MFIKYWAALTALVLFLPNTSFAEHVRTRFNQAEFLRLQFGGGNQKPLSLPPDNDGIHLAISPQCGQLSGNTADINAGIDSGKIRTIVSFGDSYTDGGKDDGSPLDPPILVPPSPLAGGRSTNGLTWVENVANDVKAAIMDYAQSGACIDLSLWPSNPRKVDFLGQTITWRPSVGSSFILGSRTMSTNQCFAEDGDHMPQAAQTLLDQIQILASPPTNARNFMVLDVYGRGTSAPSGEAFKQFIYTGLSTFHQTGLRANDTIGLVRLNISYINFANIWDGVLGNDPGFQAFGYTSTDSCTQCTADLGCTTIGMCDDPEHYFYWIPGHPSKETMRIMADYVSEVWDRCRVRDTSEVS